MTELEAGGELSIDASAGIVADYRSTGGLNASLAALAQDPATAWAAELARCDDVTWRAVNQAYTSWDHKSQGLSGPAAMVIAIAVTVATQGMGAGIVGATGATSAAMANAAFSALISQASISLISNQGDLGKVLKELGSVQTVKSLATAMATAGAFAEIGTLTDGHFGGETGMNLGNQTPLEYLGTANHAANIAGHAAVGGVASVARGGDFASGALAAGFGAAVGPAVIGLGEVQGLVATSAVGGVAAELGGGKFEDGAWTAALGYLFNACGDGGCWTTEEERSLVNQGEYASFYAKACAGGDSYACSAYEISSIHTTAGQAATNALIRDLYDIVGVRDVGALQSNMSQIRIGLARGYADYLPQSQANAMWPTAMGIAEIHWNVFSEFGLPAKTFGGTPLGRVFAPITAPITAKYVWPKWCPDCK